MPLNQANIVLLTPSIQISTDTDDDSLENIDFNFSLKNVGKDKAEEISFSLYTTTLNEDIDKSALTTTKLYKDTVINNMYPESVENIGALHLKKSKEANSGDIFFILKIMYKNENSSLFNNREEEWLWYRYQIKTKTIFSLLKTEIRPEEIGYLKKILGEYAYIIDEKINK